MSKRFRSLHAIAGLWLAMLLCAAAAPSSDRPAPDMPPNRQILVMIRQPPVRIRPDGSYGGSYDDDLLRSALTRIGRSIARRHGLTLINDWPMHALGLDCLVMLIPESKSVDTAVAEVSRDPRVAWSQPMHEYHVEGGPAVYNDPLYRAQPAARLWHLSDLHDLATGRGIMVAIIDSGIDLAHPDLAGQIAVAENVVDGHPAGAERHGTAVAAIIAARGNNGVGIVGIAPKARLIALRACWQQPPPAGSICDSISLAKALDSAIAHHAQVINMSLSGPEDILLGKLIDMCRAKGATVVAAFDATLPHGGFPASHSGVIAVAEAPLTAIGSGDVYGAPGRDIPTAAPGGRWYLVTGSSFAAAQVSGLIALVRERNPGGRNAVTLVPSTVGDTGIDALATLARANRACRRDCSSRGGPSVRS